MKTLHTWICLLLVVACIPSSICQDDSATNVESVTILGSTPGPVTTTTDSSMGFFDNVVNFVNNATGLLPSGEGAENITRQVFGATSRIWFQNLKPGDARISTCGGLSTSEKTIWQNSEYPVMEDVPGLCTLNLLPPAGTCAFRVHFDDLDLRSGDLPTDIFGSCSSKMPFFKATTPDEHTAMYCQKMDGFEGILHISDTTEPTILLLQLDPSKQFQFKVNITAVNCNEIKTYESPSNCGIKNQDLATLRSELFGVVDFDESQDSVVAGSKKYLETTYRQSKRNPVDSDNQTQEQNKNNKNKNKDKNKNQNKNGNINKNKNKKNAFSSAIFEPFKTGIDAATAAGVIPEPTEPTRVKGNPTTLVNEWPWIVTVEIQAEEDGDFLTACNGLLLDNTKVLTGRDCVLKIAMQPWGVENFLVNIGDHDLTITTEAKNQKVSISKITFPLKNDIYDTKDAYAILHLSEKVELSDTIRPICVPVSYNQFDESGVVTGWDSSFIFFLGDLPNEAKVTLTDQAICNDTLVTLGFQFSDFDNDPGRNINDVVCAEDSDNNDGVVCLFESGSSLIQRDRRGAYYVTGVAGALQQCGAPNFPTVFSKVEADNHFLNIALG